MKRTMKFLAFVVCILTLCMTCLAYAEDGAQNDFTEPTEMLEEIVSNMSKLNSLNYSESSLLSMLRSIATTQAFTDVAVERQDLEQIVQAGLSTASAINQQPWYFAVLTKQEIMTEIGGNGMNGMATLGSSPAAIVVYKITDTKSPNPDFDCGLACQNMVIAANALGYQTKIVSAPTMTLNGDRHDEICELLQVDTAYTAEAVLLIGYADTDATSSATTREDASVKVSYID